LLYVERNPELRTIRGAPALESVSLLRVTSNARLPTCEAQGFADRIDVIAFLEIQDNDDTGVCDP
jgi:hypothetical protein